MESQPARHSQDACEKSEYAQLDCSKNNFRLTINQNCFAQHWSRGDAWTETIIFGNGNETDQCTFNVRNQSSTPVEILNTQCGVTTSFPNSTDISQVTFKLSGIIRQSLIADSIIAENHDVEFECEYVSISGIEQNMKIEKAAAIKLEERLVLDSAVLPRPTICVESSSNSSSYICETQAKIGQKTLLDFPSSSNFRIDSIWIGSSAGVKTVQLVDDGCAIFPTDMVETHGRSFYWDTFTFKDKNEVNFFIKLTLCNPNDIIYCNGLSECGSNKGNRYLFEELMNSMTTTTAITTTTTTTTCDESQNGFGTITSPNEPSQYTNNEYCNYNLIADSEKIIKIMFHRFSVQPHYYYSSNHLLYDCYDWLRIDGVRYCGYQGGYPLYPPAPLIIYNQTTQITWRTDSSVVSTGFIFDWESVDQSDFSGENSGY
ncbi:unnamed protein product [Oikopleura dioica]|uniref:CUB domain-containing protein n=1 Tax=Oikopleura dioica TaxID=34765 RepID=E4XX67_OIKDI|nr:unnamed protein product [Oikopleura dioica]